MVAVHGGGLADSGNAHLAYAFRVRNRFASFNNYVVKIIASPIGRNV